MKKKVLFTSILTIVLCLCLISGASFALFTSKSEFNIAVTAAKVKMLASVNNLKLYSVEATTGGSIIDERGGTYEYVERADDKFFNGGSATLNGSTITLDKVTPGDKIAFGLKGTNESNVTIKYRYIIECAGDAELMKGLIVYVNGVAYPALKSYTSAWTTLEVDGIVSDVEIAVELPVKAGNEYQEKTTSINLSIEAVQGNADVNGAQPIYQLLDGKTELTDLTIQDTVINYGTVELVGGIYDVDTYGFENYGTATVTDAVISAGNASNYGFIGRGANSVTVLENVELNSKGGGIGIADGAKATFTSGSVYVDTASTSGRYIFYVEGAGSELTIEGGTFSWDKNDNQKRAYVYAGAGTTVTITGGTFGKASTRSGYTDGLLGSGTIIIKGGTFGFNPSKWVAEGYEAVKTNGVWVVSAK